MKICNLTYLKSLSPGNPEFIVEIINLFVKQVPLSIEEINKSLAKADWSTIQYHAHKIASQFDCMGIQKEFKDDIYKIEEYAKLKENVHLIPCLLIKVEETLKVTYKELNEELTKDYVVIK
jgi:tRNA U34 2-thiouridine synthase MnmA/TrmU